MPFFAQQISANKFFFLPENYLVKNNLWEDLEGEANKLGCWIEGELGEKFAFLRKNIHLKEILKWEKNCVFEEENGDLIMNLGKRRLIRSWRGVIW